MRASQSSRQSQKTSATAVYGEGEPNFLEYNLYTWLIINRVYKL